MSNPAWIFVPAFAIFFAAMWYFGARKMSRVAGFSESVDAEMGMLIRESKWGSAVVNGTMMSGCAKLAEYERGWLLRVMPMFGGKHLWLPRDQVKLGPPYRIGIFRQFGRDLVRGEIRVSLSTRLAAIVA